jgi:hypothetical protein
MNRNVGISLLAFGVVSALAVGLARANDRPSETAGRDPGPKPEGGTVNTLDRVCQERFETIDWKNFGISRIPVLDTPQHFGLRNLKPSTDAEKGVVADLKTGNWDAVLMVAGRSARDAARLTKGRPAADLAVQQAVAEKMPVGSRWTGRVISKPVVLTGDVTGAALPDQGQLVPKVAEAFNAFRKQGSYEFRSGEWFVVARPIRAEKKECLSCHRADQDGTKINLGDPVGVALYAFAPAGR